MKKTAFDDFAIEYDHWFDAHPRAYQSEVKAIRRFVPPNGVGVEIGVGTGRFSTPFSVAIGVEPSEPMADLARSRGIAVYRARAEALPFRSAYFDFVLMVTTLCFVEDGHAALQEAHRILNPNGLLILGIIDRETELGRVYESRKASRAFYRVATFYSTADVLDLLRRVGFSLRGICQTIFSDPDAMTAPQAPRKGYGQGAFVVIGSGKLPQN